MFVNHASHPSPGRHKATIKHLPTSCLLRGGLLRSACLPLPFGLYGEEDMCIAEPPWGDGFQVYCYFGFGYHQAQQATNLKEFPWTPLILPRAKTGASGGFGGDRTRPIGLPCFPAGRRLSFGESAITHGRRFHPDGCSGARR